jgi:hypothetical protein
MEASEFRELFPSLVPTVPHRVVHGSSGTGLALAQDQQSRQNYKGLTSMDLLIFTLASLTIVIVVSVMR